MKKIRFIPQNQATFADFQKRAGEISSLLLVVWLWLYAWISLNIFKKNWIQSSDRLLKTPQVLKVSRFWMTQYASIIPGFTSICLHVLQYVWKWVNIAECPGYAWKCQILTMPGFSIYLITLDIWQDSEYRSIKLWHY